MTVALLALTALAAPMQADFATKEFKSYAVDENRIALRVEFKDIAPAKVSPKNDWEFLRLVIGYGRLTGSATTFSPRLRVFGERQGADEKMVSVALMAMRLWDFNFQKLRFDHAEVYNNRIVDFYLCWGGKPGGEQLFASEPVNGKQVKVNTIYIYDIPSFNQPLEMAREVAHEYGHATLPPVGGFGEPEDWANGFLGEKLYLRWFRDAMAAKRLTPADAMGVKLQALDTWVKAHVDVLARQAAVSGPDKRWLGSKGGKAMDTFLGLVLYADSILPQGVFARSLKLIGSTKATDYPAAAVAAVEEAEPFTVTLPGYAAGKPVWLPLGKAKLSGGKELARRDGWVKVQPSGSKLSVTPPKAAE